MNAEMFEVYAYKGWVKIYRGFLEDPLWMSFTPKQKIVTLTLFLMANHSQRQWIWKDRRYECMPGQLVTSLKSISEKAGRGIGVSVVRNTLDRLEKFGVITQETTKVNRLITVCYWQLYQHPDEEPDTPDSKQTAKTSQTGNQPIATNKNVKNEKNEKNEKKGYPTTSFSKNHSGNYGNTQGKDDRRFKTFAEMEMEQIKARREKAWEAFMKDDDEEY